MPATVEAKTPAATTSKIIPPIMNGRTQPRKIERAIDGCRSVVSERFSIQTCSDCGASAASCRTPES
jgi:hypothetical protein